MSKRRPDLSELNNAARQARAGKCLKGPVLPEPDLLGLLAQLDGEEQQTVSVPSEQRSEGTPSGELPGTPYGQVVERSTTQLGCDYLAPNGNTGAISTLEDILVDYFSGGRL